MLTRILAVAAAVVAAAQPAAQASPKTPDILEMKTGLDREILKAGHAQKIYLRIAIAGRKPERGNRAPMNVALVIDRSGSMSGARIEAARRAALMAIDRLDSGDIVSIVSYDDRIDVDVPATRLTDREHVRARIRQLQPRGSTAIYAGLQAGAAEVRKFKSRDRVNRIVLLSDGLANVGPSQPADFAGFGRELASEGITVSTVGLGLGYNEDLMAALAASADGSHVFAEEPADLAGFIAREFDDALGIVAQDIEIIITLAPGLKPLRSLGRAAIIEGGRFRVKVGQVVGGVDQVLLAEVEVPAGMTADDVRELAKVELAYTPAGASERRTATATIGGRLGSAEASEASANTEVLRDVATLVARAERQEAVKLRDAGRVEEAQRKFKATADYLKAQQSVLGASEYAPIQNELKANEAAAAPAAASREGWSRTRKMQREADSNSAGAATRY